MGTLLFVLICISSLKHFYIPWILFYFCYTNITLVLPIITIILKQILWLTMEEFTYMCYLLYLDFKLCIVNIVCMTQAEFPVGKLS
jgi:hypothetical protein